MYLENCPYCWSTDVRLSDELWLHWVRVIQHSPKRYCFSCGKKWRRGHSDYIADRLSKQWMVTAFVMSLSLTSFFFVIMENLTNPVALVKKMVRAYYDEKYGAAGKVELWKDWGTLYGSKGEARSDYDKSDHSAH